MNIARILYPVKVLGPGNRIAIWTVGCPHHCMGCANPELWEVGKENDISIDTVIKMIKTVHAKHPIDGFTITGGEPFEQPESMQKLVEFLLTVSEDILIYSGFTRKQLQDKKNPAIDYVLDNVAVLIDGKYNQELNLGHPLRGSENQNIYYKNKQWEELYTSYINEAYGKMRVQNFTTDGGVISVGIHKADFSKRLDQLLEEKNILRGVKNE